MADPQDPRLRSGALIVYEPNLYEVIGPDTKLDGKLDEGYVRVRNLRSGKETAYELSFVIKHFTLQHAPPEIPDFPPADRFTFI